MENIKDFLGEYYLDINDYRLKKKEIIRIINKFINTNTIITSYSNDSKMTDNVSFFRNFAKNNNFTLLNINFLASNLPDTLYENYSYRRICLAYDNNAKDYKILINRSSYGGIKVLDENSRLGLDTIKDIYKCFVYKIGNYKYQIRKIKEIISSVNNLKGICYVKSFENYDELNFIKNIIIDYDYLSVSVNIAKVYIDKHSVVMRSFNNKKTYYGITQIEQLNNQIKDKNITIIKDVNKVLDIIESNKIKFLNEINNNANKIIEYVNNNFVF